jgi:hypothetical protein
MAAAVIRVGGTHTSVSRTDGGRRKEEVMVRVEHEDDI